MERKFSMNECISKLNQTDVNEIVALHIYYNNFAIHSSYTMDEIGVKENNVYISSGETEIRINLDECEIYFNNDEYENFKFKNGDMEINIDFL